MDRFAAMETFARVMESGSFSAAARSLGVGQPAVSKAVAQLEKALGVRLLLRSTRGLKPTEAGLNFYERARRALEEAQEAELAARGAGAGLSGRLRVSAPTTFARIAVLPHVGGFLDAHPGLDVEFLLEDRNIDLVEEGVDLSLRIGALADSSLTARRIGRAARVVVAAPGYLLRAGTPRAPRDLARHQAVIHTVGMGGAHWTFRKGAREESVALQGRIRSSAAEGVRAAVLAGLGLAVASEWMFAPELASGAAVRVLRGWQLPATDLWAVFPAGRLASAKARAFATFVEALMSG